MDPDYPALPEDYYPERFRPWSRNVEVASISLDIREGVPACTLSFAVRPLRALPVDWESMAPGA